MQVLKGGLERQWEVTLWSAGRLGSMQSAANPHRAEPGSGNAMVSAAEAGQILGIDRNKVYRLMAKGRIPTYGGPHAINQLRRGDVEDFRARGERIPLSEASKILRRPISAVRDLVATGELHSIANSRRPVFRGDVERYAALNPPPVRAARIGRDGQIQTPAAARILGTSPSNARRLAAAGKIPAERDELGRYWYRPEHLHLVLRARAATAAADHLLPRHVDPLAQAKAL